MHRLVHPDHQDAIFLYQGLDGEQAEFVCTNLYGEEQVVLSAPGYFKKWRPTKVTIPRSVPDALRDSCGFENSRVVQEEMKTKLTAEFLLYEKYMSSPKKICPTCTSPCPRTSIPLRSWCREMKLILWARDSSKNSPAMVHYEGTDFSVSPLPMLKDECSLLVSKCKLRSKSLASKPTNMFLRNMNAGRVLPRIKSWCRFIGSSQRRTPMP